MAQAPILAAGGIVIQSGSEPLIAVVQRRKDNGWVLPKGKLKRKETVIAAAEREAIEETGQIVSVHDYLGAISYHAGGRAKVVQFWCMASAGESELGLMKEIKTVAWLPLQAAIKRLSRPIEQAFLRQVGRHAIELAEDRTRERIDDRESADVDMSLGSVRSISSEQPAYSH
jgi:8-oxo-dGTP diphosphatase